MRPRYIKQDQIAIVRLEATQGIICLESFKEFPQMGRFTLRDEGGSFFCASFTSTEFLLLRENKEMAIVIRNIASLGIIDVAEKTTHVLNI